MGFFLLRVWIWVCGFGENERKGKGGKWISPSERDCGERDLMKWRGEKGFLRPLRAGGSGFGRRFGSSFEAQAVDKRNGRLLSPSFLL